ncbi:response regulator [Flavihumibacter sp. R14]|nr:response regulator [Flavihumibacter soli]
MIQKILIVDDDSIAGFLHKLLISECGFEHELLTFDNGRIALEYLNNKNPEFDRCILLLDINMPDINGWQLLEVLETSSFRAKLKVIMITSSIDPADVKKSKNYPLVTRFFVKPLTGDVCAELQSALA